MRLIPRQPNPTTDKDEERELAERLEAMHPDTGEKTLVQQQFKDETDLNMVLPRFSTAFRPVLPEATHPSYYGDFTDAVDFRTAVDRVKEATDRFDALPAELRARFDHNPAKLFAWVSNEKNHEEAITIGLLKKQEPPKKPEPQLVRIVAHDATATATKSNTAAPATPSAPNATGGAT